MSIERHACVYILASQIRGTLYIGVTSDLVKRLWQHREGIIDGFTAKYGVHRLVYYEILGCMEQAILREKQLKNWHRQWKINLIERQNPHWEDLAIGLGLEPLVPTRRTDGS